MLYRFPSKPVLDSSLLCLETKVAEGGEYIHPNHWQEWKDSVVSPDIIVANVQSLDGDQVYDYLFYSDQLPRTNTGRVAAFYLREYKCLEQGGWWCSGLDPLNDWKPMLWGQFKPDCPRQSVVHKDGNAKVKPVKYEPPPKVPTRAYFLNVSEAIAQRIYDRSGIQPDSENLAKGFWHCVWHYNLPIVITEGAKKAGALLTAGYAAIALPGISNGYRSPKDGNGQRVGSRHLIPELQYFATGDRPIYFCFDHDTKPSTQAAVHTSLLITGRLFMQAGCMVRVMELPGAEKGVDDFIRQRGEMELHRLYDQALTFTAYQVRHGFHLSYPVTVDVNQRYLQADLPKSGLVCIKSPKGTGKTALLEPLIRHASQTGRKTLVISHRIQLGRAICERLGLDYLSDLRRSTTQGLLGMGLCIDSLHAKSQARFCPTDWHGAIVVLDECEQVLWHMLNSTTCQNERVAIIDTFRTLIREVLQSGGLLIAQDADLSDYSVDLLQDYAEIPIEPWILVNHWKPTDGWQVHYYQTPDSGALWPELEGAIARGSVFICLDAQRAKSKWGAMNVEARLRKQYPSKRILRIDSHTVADPKHPAYGCIERLNEMLPEYDIVIASPSIGTGVSIDIQGHFVAVFGIFQGAIPDNEIRQALARVRESVPRYVWAPLFGVGRIGDGSTDYHTIATSQIKVNKLNMQLLKVDFNLDKAYDPITFRTWAKFAARVNASIANLREALRGGLLQEGHRVRIISDGDYDKPLAQQMSQIQSEIRDCTQQAEAVAIAQAPDINESEYQRLHDQRSKTQEEWYQEEKYRVHQRYGIEVTPELYQLDQDGWYSKLRLHYYLQQPPSTAKQRDRLHWQDRLSQGNGQYCPQDTRTYTERVEALRELNVLQFLDGDRDWCGTDPQVLDFADKARRWKHELRTLFRVSISDELSPIQIVQLFLDRLGLKLTRDRRARLADGSRCWMYRFCAPNDGRDRIFAFWHQKDNHSQPTPETVTAVATEEVIPVVAEKVTPPLYIYINNQGDLDPGHPPTPETGADTLPQDLGHPPHTEAVTSTPVPQSSGHPPTLEAESVPTEWLTDGAIAEVRLLWSQADTPDLKQMLRNLIPPRVLKWAIALGGWMVEPNPS